MSQLQLAIHEEMIEYIKEEIKLNIEKRGVDNPLWMANNNENFTVKSVYKMMRKKKVK